MSRSGAAGRNTTRLHRRQDSIQDAKTAKFIMVRMKFEYQINLVIAKDERRLLLMNSEYAQVYHNAIPAAEYECIARSTSLSS